MGQLYLLLMFFVSLTASSQQSCEDGKGVFVHLFEWKWTDIARECEQFLAGAGYCGVQISPPHEHRVVDDPATPYPWWQRYQPVSYLLESRSGNQEEFIDMVGRCNQVGVRIYADVVINHMASDGFGYGSGGSYWNADQDYFPEVPYSTDDFHGSDVCFTHDMNIHDYQNPDEVRYCRLNGLRDLRHESTRVRERILDYMNTLISYGVAGFRIDASKHMFPRDAELIYNDLRDLNSAWFPPGSRPFIFQEVIDLGGEPIRSSDYTHLGKVSEFKYGKELGDHIRKNGGRKLSYLRTFGEAWNMLPSNDALAFLDNHDNQRGHGAGGFGTILTFFESRLYKMASAFELAWPYGSIRVMSSYNWPRYVVDGRDVNDWMGPPSDGYGNTRDADCNSQDWICEHRWRQIANMVAFHNVASGQPVVHWWDNGQNAIAFGRGDKGFVFINGENYPMNAISFQTGLPDGEYCDVNSCQFNKPGPNGCGETSDGCRGVFYVSGGWVTMTLPNDENPVIALHV